MFADDDDDNNGSDAAPQPLRSEDEFRRRAADIYAYYAGPLKRRFKWLAAERFQPKLAKDLYESAMREGHRQRRRLPSPET